MLTQNDLKILKELFIPQFKDLDSKIDVLNLKLTGKIDVLGEDIVELKKEVKKLKNDVKQLRKDINIVIEVFDRNYLSHQKRLEKLEMQTGFASLN